MGEIFQIIILVSVILFIFGVFLIWFLLYHSRRMAENKYKLKQQELEQSEQFLKDSIEIQESERSRIGADIHDDIGPLLSAIKMKVYKFDQNDTIPYEDKAQLKELIESTIKSVRKTSTNLYPNTLEEMGLINAIEELGNRIENDADIVVKVVLDKKFKRLDMVTQLGLYRITQEFINNSLKYSQCGMITIFGTVDKESHLTWILEDNGIGFDMDDIASKGLGLKNMKMRSKLINFEFNLKSSKNTGTTLELKK